MKIAISTIYGAAYAEDRLFDPAACKIGENLLIPNVILKQRLELCGHELHSIDMYNISDVDIAVFQDIPDDSLLTIRNPIKLLKYILKAKWRKDYFFKAVKALPTERTILQINEPPTVAPISYDKRLHQHFGKILTWNDDLVDNEKYFKFCIPQYLPEELPAVPFAQKKMLVVIAGNKTSPHTNELYSARREVINYFEDKPDAFDLYGFGWENEKLKNYHGKVDKKLATLAKYKYCVCFENIRDLNGYITEKMFDCLFAGCVPVYWGAGNVVDYIPADLFVDMRNFSSIDKMYEYLNDISEAEYMGYLQRAKDYLNGSKFKETFSVDAYVKTMIKSLGI